MNESQSRSYPVAGRRGFARKDLMTTMWKVFVLLSLSLNLVCFATIASIGERMVEAQAENLNFFQKLSFDQQSLRRELNQAAAHFNGGASR